MISFDSIQFFIFGLYLAATILMFLGTGRRNEKLKRFGNSLVVGGFALHTMDLILLLGWSPQNALLHTNFYLSLFGWSLLSIYFLLWWKLKIDFLALTAAPLALLLFTSSFVFNTKVAMPKELHGLFFSLHIGSLFLAIALLAMAFGAGVAFLFMERKIKMKEKLEGFEKDLPSLSTFDKANELAVVAGFPFYTIGLLTGFIWARLTWGKVFSWDPKEIMALLIWFGFAFLFHQRIVLGWQGRKPARLAIWLFVFSIVSMLGINMLMPTHHSFNQMP